MVAAKVFALFDKQDIHLWPRFCERQRDQSSRQAATQYDKVAGNAFGHAPMA
jgi:hypothetical protein